MTCLRRSDNRVQSSLLCHVKSPSRPTLFPRFDVFQTSCQNESARICHARAHVEQAAKSSSQAFKYVVARESSSYWRPILYTACLALLLMTQFQDRGATFHHGHARYRSIQPYLRHPQSRSACGRIPHCIWEAVKSTCLSELMHLSMPTPQGLADQPYPRLAWARL